MRAVIQRVTMASVKTGSDISGQIGPGLLVLLGIEEGDNNTDIDWLCGKIANLRIFSDKQDIMNHSVIETGGDVLVVSQFTLHASTRKGNRPSYIRAAKPETAIPIYQNFTMMLEQCLGKKVQTGVFGAMMQVTLVNDGPVTIIIDTKNRE